MSAVREDGDRLKIKLRNSLEPPSPPLEAERLQSTAKPDCLYKYYCRGKTFWDLQSCVSNVVHEWLNLIVRFLNILYIERYVLAGLEGIEGCS